ncbi:hypothetical protein PTSG_03429 [Salpingoeca rosetta]|uniref:Uncharacterized protein n=1 Tax=Salpingoeca rosetta (strain ATCC 50818 / BSB-021) TaxID=946362 RepID=F2U563_SALR5|nr:uncharacterized protein PTSG_03429 [Salpingoeca rosetta]EGD82779.1 hypothetical protein PTSG_03429 [Salpingoeca rosetta]|eukprot:XP_004996015.1 hypothetical protein PTSG_03429 [Salpingoeca rosetta]
MQTRTVCGAVLVGVGGVVGGWWLCGWLREQWQRGRRARSKDTGAWGDLEMLKPDSGASKDEVAERYARLRLQHGDNTICTLSRQVLTSVLGYDPSDQESPVLQAFRPLKTGTHCSFAKRAVVWACHGSFSLETISTGACGIADGDDVDAVDATLRAMALFASACHKIDAFVIALPPASTIQEHGSNVRRLLTWLSDMDPSGRRCMAKSVDKSRWVFTFAGNEFFITTFAPCYPRQSSRYQFGVRDAAFILFQPYHSFLLHRVGVETSRSETNYTHPANVRDEIRARFARHGSPYFVPEDPARMPNCHQAVSPLTLHAPAVRWWLDTCPLSRHTLQQLEVMGWKEEG